jgi:hypothetical protein
MKFYEVEYRAVITLAAQDMQKAALHGAAVIKDNPHLIQLRAVHERNLEPAWEDPSPKNSQKDSLVATLPFRGPAEGAGLSPVNPYLFNCAKLTSVDGLKDLRNLQAPSISENRQGVDPSPRNRPIRRKAQHILRSLANAGFLRFSRAGQVQGFGLG